MWNRVYRILIHIPVGITCGYMTSFDLSGVVGAIIFALFFKTYELNEDHYIKDEAWKDIAGFLWGVAIYFIGRGIYQYASQV